jgi:hypothetical protein
MHHYSAFGRCLGSELPFPDLPPATTTRPDWCFHVVRRAAPAAALEPVGQHEVEGWYYHLYRTAAGFRLVFAEHYHFDILERGTRIVWYPTPQATEENVRALVLGPLLALAQHLAGATCLHGSAVSVAGQGIALLAPKYHGKSTLSLALTLAGAQLLSDDAVAVDLGSPPRVRPGVHSVRLWGDSTSRLRAGDLDCVLVGGVKNTLTRLPPHLLQQRGVPLASLYVLEPLPPGGEVVVERVALSGLAAALQLVQHAKLPPTLLGAAGAGEQLRYIGALARAVPVYRLRFARDFDLLPTVVEQVLSWHASPVAPPPRNAPAAPAGALNG